MKTYDEIKRLLNKSGMTDETLGKLVSAYDLIADAKGLSTSGNKAYILCMLTLDLYQRMGIEAERQYPVEWGPYPMKHGTWYFDEGPQYPGMTRSGLVMVNVKGATLGGVWFTREVDRIEAVDTCGIDEQFQSMCARFGVGGA